MNHYQHLLAKIAIKETAVDCGRCELEWKCCTYRPFIANFLVGGFADADFFNQDLQLEWDFLLVGLSPNLKYRKYFSKKGKWGFGTDATLLCSFYQKSSGGCRVWQHRPAVCRTFFCKSSYQESGAYYWKKAEEWTWLVEWTLLEDFLHHKGWSLEEVSQIKHYLQEDQIASQRHLPEEYFLKSVTEARQFYQEAKLYVDQLSEEDIFELLGERGQQGYQELVASKQKLR